MHEKTVSPELIRRQGEELQALSHDDARAQELAVEVQRLNTRVRESAELLAFDDEPLAFQVRMSELARNAGEAPTSEPDAHPPPGKAPSAAS